MKFKFPKFRFTKKLTLPKIKLPTEIIAILFIFLLMGLAFFPSFEFSPSQKLTAAEFANVCDKAGYTVADDSASYHADFFSEVISASGENYYIGYYAFTHRAYAKAYYTLYLSALQTGARTEKYTYTSDYNRFYTSTDEGLIFLYRNQEKMIYINGHPPHNTAFEALIENLDI